MMKATYRTPDAFFVSAAGRRVQEQIKDALSPLSLQGRSAALFGNVFPFLAAFDQNTPDIVSETNFFSKTEDPAFLLKPQSLDLFFISALDSCLIDALPRLIKEAFSALKAGGILIPLIKNKKLFDTLSINQTSETNASALTGQLSENGFSLKNRKGLLHFPYASRFFETADNLLFSLNIGGGCFTLLSAVKNPTVIEKIENYSSTRITKASVFTSPRT